MTLKLNEDEIAEAIKDYVVSKGIADEVEDDAVVHFDKDDDDCISAELDIEIE